VVARCEEPGRDGPSVDPVSHNRLQNYARGHEGVEII
jgi:hypothetical protein